MADKKETMPRKKNLDQKLQEKGKLYPGSGAGGDAMIYSPPINQGPFVRAYDYLFGDKKKNK